MRWWGESWDAPVCDAQTHIDTPAGQRCTWCDEEIGAEDSGVSMRVLHLNAEPGPDVIHYHRNCWLRSVVGSVGHQRGHVCSDPHADGDPPGMTARQAADAAVAMFYAEHG